MRHSYGWLWQFAYAGHTCKNPSRHQHSESRWHGHGGGGFGVRRPLRFLSHRLDLDESQTRRMASVLNQLKTEQEQAELDTKRTVTAIADLMSTGTPTLDEVRSVLTKRSESLEKMNDETAKAVVAISDFLDEDQKQEFISLLLSGAFSL